MSLPGLSDPGDSGRVFPLPVVILRRQTPCPKASRNWGRAVTSGAGYSS